MTKNGLFLISIGLLIFMYSANQNTQQYDILSMVTAIFLVALGSFLVFKDRKKNKQQTK